MANLTQLMLDNYLQSALKGSSLEADDKTGLEVGDNIHMIEMELQKVHQAYEDLMKSSEKKEKLERAIRYKLEIEIKSLKDENKTLKEHLNAALSTMSKRNPENFVDDNEFRSEIQRRDILVARLLSQSKYFTVFVFLGYHWPNIREKTYSISFKNLIDKELLTEKERQEIELQAQRLTLEEQRNHIEVLDNALMNAQNNVVKLEGELRKKNAFEERANHLQKALGNLQLASERRSQMEKRVRNHLEKEIKYLKKQLNGSVQISDEKKEVESLKKALVDYEEKMIQLENEVAKWENKYFEESTMRKIEVNAASVPKDAKIAALEQTFQQSEKMIQEVRNERLKQMDELHGAHKKVTQLESKIRDLESKLAEKDAMIKVLQQHSLDKDVVLQKSLLAQRSATGRHARSASSMGLTTFSPGSNNVSSRGISASVSEVKESSIRSDNVDLYSTGIKSKTLSSSNSSSPTSFLKESNTSPGGLLEHCKLIKHRKRFSIFS